MNKKYLVSGGILMLLLIFGGGWVLAQGDNVILVCAAKDGTLRLIANQDECKDKETFIELNNLTLAGQNCPPFQYVVGFDQNGDILCADPRPGFTPVEANADWSPVIQEFNGVPMALVPTGCYLPGDDITHHEDGEEHCFYTPFWIDVYEVSNAQYGSSGDFEGDNRPRENLSWNDAKTFCETRGASLPDEYDWEYAARGPDLLVYPWGDVYIDANVVSWTNNCDEGTCDIGSRPGGVSWVGAQDMAGNVLEFMMDDFDNTSTIVKVVRGGTWFDEHTYFFRSSTRVQDFSPNQGVGFRCVRPY